MKKTIISMLLMAAPIATFAQLKVSSTGNVSIGTSNTYSFANMYVGNSSVYNNNGSNIGIVGTRSVIDDCSNIGIEGYLSPNSSTSSDKNYGVLGIINSSTATHGRNFGVSGMINYVNGAGVFGAKNMYHYYYPLSVSGQYAGYFYGPVYMTESLTVPSVNTTSDRRLKENVVSLEEMDDNGKQTLQNVLNMNVVEYNLKERQQMQTKDANVELPEEMAAMVEADKKEKEAQAAQRHYGLIAQELQDIYPTLVQEGQDGYLSINYIELVPILIRSIQTLKQELDDMKGENRDVMMSRGAIPTTVSAIQASGNVLYQNSPNPFKELTTIRFSLADDVQNAAICIFDMTGKMLKKLPVSLGDTSVKINGWELGEGMFLYTLIVNGREIDTKRMIITR